MNCELLAPAGGIQSARAALCSGADAVYLGVHKFSARASAQNFGNEELSEVLEFAHLLGAKVYVALNTLVKDSETEEFFETARLVWNAGADAILLQDLFLGRELKTRYPEITLHLSTQAGCCNVYGAEVAKEYGFSRAVLARETPISDIAQISKIIETEVFVQGALCTAFSGQCYFSSFAGNMSGNRGQCKQPCRKKYQIDRKGFEEFRYALSTSDLYLGGRLQELLNAGVSSLKIEGRMRREEYVSAAVTHYRALLAGAEGDFGRLRRAYNRGDYTEGLGFGQRRGFLSRDVQGHIGEHIGEVTLRRGMPFCRTSYPAERGDGFKILRQGLEVGGATLRERAENGFYLSSRERLNAGDEVRLTTCLADGSALQAARVREIPLTLRFVAGEAPEAVCGDFTYRGEAPLARAERAPLTEAELVSCFQRTDGLPLLPKCTVETQDAFLPKSALNAFRRTFYASLKAYLLPRRTPLEPVEREVTITPVKGHLEACITDMVCQSDIIIYKPKDYRSLSRPAGEKVYLYLPPFFTSQDEALISSQINLFDGLYAEGYYGIALAKKYQKPLFAGIGFNLTNRYAVEGVSECAAQFALSKELSAAEQDVLSAEGAFVLSSGGIKLMDLCYCPFERSCASCDRRDVYRLTDEAGRVFPLRRYRISGDGCRFEVYNCAALMGSGRLASRLRDGSIVPAGTTKGHSERSML